MVDLDNILTEAFDKMQKSHSMLKDQFAGLRTGKASSGLVENVSVVYYGAPTRLRDLANISTPEPRMIVINAFDPSALRDIEKAILAANLGVTPLNDGKLIRVPIPELSEERRKELVKVARRHAEEGRISVRNVRREANDAIKALQKDAKISEDDREQALGKIQKETDSCIAEIDEDLAAKEAEILEV